MISVYGSEDGRMWAWVSMKFPPKGVAAGVVAVEGIPDAGPCTGIVVGAATRGEVVPPGVVDGETGTVAEPCWEHPATRMTASRSMTRNIAVRTINLVSRHGY